MRWRLVLGGLVLASLLGFPATATAGIMDIIWEMSGPQMIGGVIRCRFPFDDTYAKCELSVTAANKAERIARNEWEERLWFALEGGVLTSTGHNARDRSGDIDYKFGRIWMLGVEPILEGSWKGDIKEASESGSGKGVVYHGAGLFYNRFIVHDAKPLNKAGVKLRPIGIMYSGWGLEYNIRLYPRGFTPDEFGFGDRIEGVKRPFEAVHSVGILLPWPRWRLWPTN